MKTSLIRMTLVVLGLIVAKINSVEYTAFPTENGVVYCADATTLEDASDETLAALTRPQTIEAIEFCQGGGL